jgi:hypothetical protein
MDEGGYGIRYGIFNLVVGFCGELGNGPKGWVKTLYYIFVV